MFKKINITKIIQGHNATLHSMSHKKIIELDSQSYKKNDINFQLSDFLLFYLLPVFIAFPVLYITKIIPKDGVSIIVNTAAIFLGLMLTALILIIDRRQKSIQDMPLTFTKKFDALTPIEISYRLRVALLKEIYYNISYSMLVALLIIIIGIILNLLPVFPTNNFIQCLQSGLSGLLISSIINLLLTIIMIIKRICSVFES